MGRCRRPVLLTCVALSRALLSRNCVQAMETAANGGLDLSQPTEILGLVGLAATAAVGLGVARTVSRAIAEEESTPASQSPTDL